MKKTFKKIKSKAMRKPVLFILLISLPLSLFSQKSPVDEIFNRYDGREGFTSVYISSKMFGLLAKIDRDDDEFRNLVTRIKSIRILSIDSASNLSAGINFSNMLLPALKKTGYEELMTVREDNSQVQFMVREAGGRIAELVMITGGHSSSIVSITGDLDLKTIASLSGSMGIDELQGLDKVDK
jgi:hypothetical protein